MLKKVFLFVFLFVPVLYSGEILPPGYLVSLLPKVKADKIDKEWSINYPAIMKKSPMSKKKLAAIFASLDIKSVKNEDWEKIEQLVCDKKGRVWKIKFEEITREAIGDKIGIFYRVISVKLKKDK